MHKTDPKYSNKLPQIITTKYPTIDKFRNLYTCSVSYKQYSIKFFLFMYLSILRKGKTYWKTFCILVFSVFNVRSMVHIVIHVLVSFKCSLYQRFGSICLSFSVWWANNGKEITLEIMDAVSFMKSFKIHWT